MGPRLNNRPPGERGLPLTFKYAWQSLEEFNAESSITGADINGDRQHELPGMTAICAHCGDYMWPWERSGGTVDAPQFNVCCRHGSVRIDRLQPSPPFM